MHCEDCNNKGISKECPNYTRQSRIKQIMSIEKKNSEASERVPCISHKANKFKEKYPNFRRGDFPVLKANS